MNLSDQDIYLFREGTHARLYRTMGCQLSANRLATMPDGASRFVGTNPVFLLWGRRRTP